MMDFVNEYILEAIEIDSGRIKSVKIRKVNENPIPKDEFNKKVNTKEWNQNFYPRILKALRSNGYKKIILNEEERKRWLIRGPQGGILLFLKNENYRYLVLEQRDMGTSLMTGCLDCAAGAGIPFIDNESSSFSQKKSGLEIFRDVMLKEFYEEYMLVDNNNNLIIPFFRELKEEDFKRFKEIKIETAREIGIKYRRITELEARLLKIKEPSKLIVLSNEQEEKKEIELECFLGFEPYSLETIQLAEINVSSLSKDENLEIPVRWIFDGELASFGALKRNMYLINLEKDEVILFNNRKSERNIMKYAEFFNYVRNNFKKALETGIDPYTGERIRKKPLENIKYYIENGRIATQKVLTVISRWPDIEGNKTTQLTKEFLQFFKNDNGSVFI